MENEVEDFSSTVNYYNENGEIPEKQDEYLTYNDVQIRPKYSEIASRSNCDLSSQFTRNYRMEAPFIASPMDTVCEEDMAFEMWRLGGVGIIHRFDEIETQANRVKKVLNRSEKYLKENNLPSESKPRNFAAAIGATGDYMDRARALIEAGANVLLLDVAHGHHSYLKTALSNLNNEWPEVDYIAGSIATKSAAKDLIEWGADSIRGGQGNGSMCETRIRTGIGVPQVSALKQISNAVKDKDQNIPIIADGGIKNPGDLAKAVASGASSGMLGSVFSGTKETPGTIQRKGMWPDEELFKQYRGSASFSSKKDRDEETKNIEGNAKTVKYKGKTKRIFRGLKEGLQSSMSYVGVDNISDFQKEAELLKVTNAGHAEGTPHGMN